MESAEETPAKPAYARPPNYPAACEPGAAQAAADASVTDASVTVVYSVTRDGQAESVRVREASDPCFEDAAVAAVRGWRFEPRRVNGRARAQEDMETTFRFVFEEDTQALNFDARPIMRVPPEYPERCMRRARSIETVLVRFDVTETGETENIQVYDSTEVCLNKSAIQSVEQWRYRPKLVDGRAVRRNGAETAVTYRLAPTTSVPPRMRVRNSISSQLRRIARDVEKGRNYAASLERLAAIEEKFGDDFSQIELVAFHYARATVHIGLEDYRRALDDLNIVQLSGMAGGTTQAVADTIAKLESVIAAQEAEQPTAPQADQ